MDFRLKEQLNTQVDRILQVVQTLKKEKEVLLNQINQLKQKNSELESLVKNSRANESKYSDEINGLLAKIKEQQATIENQASQIDSLQSKVATQNNDTAEIENKLMEIINCLSNENVPILSENIADSQNETQPITGDVAETVLNKFTVEDVDKESNDIDKLLEDFQISAESSNEPVSDEAVVTSDQFNIDNSPNVEQTMASLDFGANQQKSDMSFDRPQAESASAEDNGIYGQQTADDNQTGSFFAENAAQADNVMPTVNVQPTENDVQTENAETSAPQDEEISLFDDVAEAAQAPAENAETVQTAETQDSEMDFGALTSMFNEPAAQDNNETVAPEPQTQYQDNQPVGETVPAEPQNSDILSNISSEDYNPLLFEDSDDNSEVDFDLPEDDDSEDDNRAGSYNDGWADGVL